MNYPATLAVKAANQEVVDWVRRTGARHVAEFGIYRGYTSRAIACALPPEATLDLFDFHTTLAPVMRRLEREPDVQCTVTGHGNTDRYLDSYCWSLMRVLEKHSDPIWDFVYVDGAHTWAVDGFAVLLTDRLLKPGGHIFLDDYRWTLAASPSLRPKAFPLTARMYTDEQINTPQVERIASLLLERSGYEAVLPTKCWRKP